MSDVRFAVWMYKTGHSQSKSFKLPSLPPMSEAFELHVKRAHHQVCIWINALESEPPALAAAEYEWKVNNSNKSLLPIAMPADAMPAPAPVLSLLCCVYSADEACSSRRCSCHRSGMACSIFCKCSMTPVANCVNPINNLEAATLDSDDEDNQDSDSDHED